MLGVVVPLGKQSDAVGRVKMGLWGPGGDPPGSGQGEEGDGQCRKQGGQAGTCQCEVLGPKCCCVLRAWGQGRLWWPLSRGLAAGKGALLPGSTVTVPRPCGALNAAASPMLVWPLFCTGGSHLWGLEPSFLGSRAIYLACGWRDSPPNALYSPLCRLLQQMTRSQQMDELLDVLIESGGTPCFPVPLRGFPSRPALVCGAQCILCTPAELPESSTAFTCPPCASSH